MIITEQELKKVVLDRAIEEGANKKTVEYFYKEVNTIFLLSAYGVKKNVKGFEILRRVYMRKDRIKKNNEYSLTKMNEITSSLDIIAYWLKLFLMKQIMEANTASQCSYYLDE